MLSNGTFPSQLLFSGGAILNVGDSPDDGFIIDGLVTMSGATEINVSGYYKHISGKVSFSADLTLDISTEGAIPSSVDEHNVFLGSEAEGVEYDFGDGNVFLNTTVHNGNLGTKEEIYIKDAKIDNIYFKGNR